MQQKNLVIFDEDIVYAKRLMEQLMEKKENPFRVYVFTDFQKLDTFSQKQKIEILLTDEQFGSDTKKVKNIRVTACLSKKSGAGQEDGSLHIFKYQSTDQILSEILALEKSYGSGLSVPRKKKGEGRIIGVYSPIHRIGKTRFALELGKKYAKEEPTLYLNLEEYAGRNLPKGEAQQGLSELLYYAKQERQNLGIRLSGMVYQRGVLDCVAPMMMAQDLRGVTADEWKNLFQQIFAESVYGTIVLDIGESIQGIYEILQICQQVYTPYIDKQPEKSKLTQYVENLRILGLEEILEHTIQKKMKTGS